MINALLLLWALWWPAPTHAHGTGTARDAADADSTVTHARLLLSISEFHVLWQRAWRASEDRRTMEPGVDLLRARRAGFNHCHLDSKFRPATSPRAGTGTSDDFARPLSAIGTSASAFGACPTWLMASTIPMAQDEGRWLDGALLDALRGRIRSARAALLVELDSAAAHWPADGWITGQRVRFRIDQRDLEGALENARSCRAEEWWCAALSGFVLATRGENQPAEAAFVRMQMAMGSSAQCRWNDVHPILLDEGRSFYATLDCAKQAELNATLWWLADPLYRVAGNDRLLEHNRRQVEVVLHQATVQDGRYSWDTARGGDALAEMFIRYGHATYAAWGGDNLDNSHSGYLEGLNSPPAPPYTTFEYPVGRVHAVPSWQTVRDPLAAGDSSWLLSLEDATDRFVLNWWPEEHFRTARRLVQLSSVGQTAMLRRQTQVVVAAALPVQHATLFADTSTFDVMLLATTGASHVDSLAQTVAAGGTTVALHGLLAPTRALLAIEALGTGTTSIDARTRFAIAPPPPLAAMRSGEIAQSDPVLIDVRDGTADMLAPSESLLDHMLGTLHFTAGLRRIGLYWESYGIAANDTVMVSVKVAGDRELSGLRQLGVALNVADNPNRAIVQRWTEPDVQRSTRTLTGPVPVQMRTVVLNLAQLVPGPYVLEVSITPRRGAVITSRRRIVLQ